MASSPSNRRGTLRESEGDSIVEPVPPSLTLTRAELEQLCETVQPKRFAEWLTARGWVFEPARGRRGFPKVDRAYYLARMSGQQPGTRRAGPRLEFMLHPR